MRGAVLHAPGDIRLEERPNPTIQAPTDAIIKLAATCVCGSDLWSYRGINPVTAATPMGHEYVGIVEEVGTQVRDIAPGQFVVGSFFASDNTCAICRAGFQTSCVQREPVGAGGAQTEYLRVPLAVVGDGAVGLLAVLAARELGAERIVAMSRHDSRQRLAPRGPAAQSATWACPTTSSCQVESSSTPMCASWAARPRCGSTFRTSSSRSGTVASTPARCST